MNSNEDSYILEERGVHAILISLYFEGVQKKTSLLGKISRSSSIGKRIDGLEKSGLVTVTIDRFNSNTKWVELTERGTLIAKLLFEIGEMMENNSVERK